MSPCSYQQTPRKSRCLQLLKTFSWNEILRWKYSIQRKEKTYIIGDSNFNRIRKAKFKESTPKARVYVKPFSVANTNQLDY